MSDPLTLVVVAVLVGGVLASFAPVVPGAVLSLLGLLGYAILGGTEEIWWVWLVLLIGLTLLAAVFDLVATVVTTRYGGAPNRAALLGVGVGIALFFVLGPIGLVVGIAVTVFGFQYWRGESFEKSARAGVYATTGVLASKVVQIAITAIVLIAFVALVWV